MHVSGLRYTVVLPDKLQKIQGEKVVQRGDSLK